MANLPFASGSMPPSAGLTPQLTWSAAIDPTMDAFECDRRVDFVCNQRREPLHGRDIVATLLGL
jgi:hypothetical protein